MSLKESKPPPALLEPMLSAAAYHRARGQLDEALDAYKKALMIAPDADPQVLASIYAHVGAIKRAQDKPREAELNFEKALSAYPAHMRSLEALLEIAVGENDHLRMVTHRRRIAALIEDPLLRSDELARIATILADALGDTRGAVQALVEARDLRPGDPVLLTRLTELLQRLGDWPRVIETLGELCLELDEPAERARIRMMQAEVAWEHARDAALAAQLLEGTLEEDPAHASALARIVDLRTRRQEWKELERVYTRLVDRFAERGKVDRAWEFCRRLALLRRDSMGDVEAAIDAFSGVLRCKPDDVDARTQLADLFAAQGDNLAAVRELALAATQEPRRRQTYRRLFELHTQAGRGDRAWLAAMALEQLAGAEVDHDVIASHFRPGGGGTIRPAAALDDAAWDAFLRAPGYAGGVGEVLRAVAPAAIAVKADMLAQSGKVVALDPARLEGHGSTVTAVRSFAWAGQVLGISIPDIYQLDGVPGGIAAIQSPTPATALGPDVLAGCSQQELAFLAGRHLTYYRPEHYALVFFPSLAELTELFVAAVTSVMPEVPVPAAAEEHVGQLRRNIQARLDDDSRAALADAVKRFDAECEGKADLAGFIRSVELSACRAGLVLTADLAVAARVLQRERRSVADLAASDRLNDLLAYCAQEQLAVLREWLGVAASNNAPAPVLVSTPSMAPPPSVRRQSVAPPPPPSVRRQSAAPTAPPSVGRQSAAPTAPPSVGRQSAAPTAPPSVGRQSAAPTAPPSVGRQSTVPPPPSGSRR